MPGQAIQLANIRAAAERCLGNLQALLHALSGAEKAAEETPLPAPASDTYDRARLLRALRLEEGFRSKVYQDSLGVWTIGIGRNVQHKGLSEDEALYLLANDVREVAAALDDRLPWWRSLNPVRQETLIQMGFQLGIAGLLGFKNTLGMMERGDFGGAARGMLNSLWARQTPARVGRLAEQMRTGKSVYD